MVCAGPPHPMTHDEWWDRDLDDSPIGWTVRGAVRRIVATVLFSVAWLSGALLCFGFWARGLTLPQEIVVAVVFVLGYLGALFAIWVSFGIRAFQRWVDW